MHAWADASFAMDTKTRRSTSGYIFQIGNSTISWSSRLQRCVTLSSTEAEYVALASAAQESLWLQSLMRFISLPLSNSPIVIHEDNRGAIDLTSSTKHHSRTKHIDVRFHFLRELVGNKQISVHFCPSTLMLADLFTKPLASPQFLRLRSRLGVTSPGSRGCIDSSSLSDPAAASDDCVGVLAPAHEVQS